MHKRKVPAPIVVISVEDWRTVVHLEWEWFSIQMFDDEALRMARMIHDAVEDFAVGPPNGLVQCDDCGQFTLAHLLATHRETECR